MRTTPSWELQKAVYQRLKSSLPRLKIFDDVPQDEKMPYVVLAYETAIPWDTKTSYGEEITLTLVIHSEYRGFKEIKEISNEIIQCLDIPLTLDSFKFAIGNLEFRETSRQELNRVGILRFRFKIFKED